VSFFGVALPQLNILARQRVLKVNRRKFGRQTVSESKYRSNSLVRAKVSSFSKSGQFLHLKSL
jgi:hypothetical protein